MTDPQPGCSARLARLTAGLLAALFVVALPPAMLIHGVGQVLFSPARVSRILTANLVDSGMLQRLAVTGMIDPASAFPSGGEGGEEEEGPPAEAESGPGSDFLSYLGRADLERVYEILFPPDWTREQIETLVADLDGWIDSEEVSPRLSLATGPLRQRLLDGGLDRIMVILIDSWPACTDEQVAEITLILDGGEGSMEGICQPAEPIRSRTLAFMTEGFRQQVEELPPVLNLNNRGTAGAEPEGPSSGPDLVMAQGLLRAIRAGSRWVWLIPASLLGLIMALVVRSRRGLARWWGTSLLVGGLASLAFALAAGFLVRNGIQDGLARMEGPAAFSEVARAMGEGFLRNVVGLTVLQAGVISLVGGAMRILGRRSKGESVSEITFPGRHAIRDPEDKDDSAPSGMFG
jgi:hypothetical protein